MANGTATLIYLHPDAASRRAALDAHFRAASWAGAVFAADELGSVGHAPHQGLAFAVSMRSDDGLNAFGVPGRSLAAKPRWDKPDRLGCGQHGGLGAWEQSPVLMIDGPGFAAGGERGVTRGLSIWRRRYFGIWAWMLKGWMGGHCKRPEALFGIWTSLPQVCGQQPQAA